MKERYSKEANSGLPIQLFRKPKGQMPYNQSPCPVPDKFSAQAMNRLFKINFNIVLRPMTKALNDLLSPGLYSHLPTDKFYSLFYHISRT
jgi:hypothetical protein